MLKMEEFFVLKDLYEQGMKISDISRSTGIDRKTVRKYVHSSSLPVSVSRSVKKSKLDDFKRDIVERLKEYPISAVRLFREIQAKGYTGGYTIVKDFVRETRSRLGVPAVLRFETRPGLQAQVDWAELAIVEVDGVRRKLYCFTMILGYSRMRYAELTLSIDTPTLIKCHLNAFQFFGGFPGEVLYDNMKQVVIKRALQSKDSVWNPLFKDFFEYMGFLPRLCRPYRPQTKGKIESTVKYIKYGFFNGTRFDSLEDIESGLRDWLFRVNSCVHGTTREVPVERLKNEGLQRITVPGYRVVVEESRKVSRESFVSYRGNQYSVPYRYAGRNATIRIDEGLLKVFVGAELLCTHEILPGSGRVSRDQSHFKGLLQEIMDEEPRRRQGLPVLVFDPVVEVEKRSLSVYEALCGDAL
jgi:transposase